MTALTAQAADIPAPVPSRLLAPYWEGCRVGQLRYLRCLDCGAPAAKPGPVCSRCTSRLLQWEVSTGKGRLYSWTVVWRPQHPSFRVPYAPAIVTIDEGVQVLTSIIGCDTDDLRPDLRVQVEFHPAGDLALPYFRPADPLRLASVEP